MKRKMQVYRRQQRVVRARRWVSITVDKYLQQQLFMAKPISQLLIPVRGW